MTKRGKSKPNAAQVAADKLRDRILLGKYLGGQSLPGERELSAELGVSRLTLRSSLAQLESQGLVRAVHGSGTRVLEYRENAGVELLADLARLALAGAPIPGGLEVLTSLLELRRAIAVEALGLATERASAGELRAMRDQIDLLGKLVGDAHAFMVADLALARMIMRATHNLAFELLFNTVMRTVSGNPGVELAFAANAKSTHSTYVRLIDRMEAGDVERVRATAQRLLNRLDRNTIDALRALFAMQTPTKSRKR